MRWTCARVAYGPYRFYELKAYERVRSCALQTPITEYSIVGFLGGRRIKLVVPRKAPSCPQLASPLAMGLGIRTCHVC